MRLSGAAAGALLFLAAAPAPAEEPAEERAGEERPGLEAALDEVREASTLRRGEAVLHIGGYFAADLVRWDRRNERHSGLEGSAARPRVDLRYGGALRAFAEGDLLGSDTPDRLYEAWAEWRPSDSVRIRGGLVRAALGTEFATREEDLPVPGYSFTSFLDGRRDVGLQVDGDLAGEVIWWQATAASGHGFGLDGRTRTSPQASVRVVVRPGRREAKPAPACLTAHLLDGFFWGGGFALLGDFEDAVTLEAPLGSTVFRTRDLGGDGGRWVHLEAGYAGGPVAGGIEVVRGTADGVPVGGARTLDMNQLTAWTATLAVSLTGERREWKDGGWAPVEPRGAGGAWEVAVRYSNGDIDRALFDEGYARYDASTQEVRTFSVLLGWRPAPGLRVALGWVKTIADDAIAAFGGSNPANVARAGGDGRDSSFVLRLEVAF